MTVDTHTRPNFATAALITIDTQCDVLDGGTLGVPGTTAALSAISALAAAFRLARRPIVHAVRLYLADGSNVDPCRRGSVVSGARTLIAGTDGAELAPGVAPDPETQLDDALLLRGELQSLGPDEVAMYKPRWGAFFQTPLEAHLRERGVTTLVFAGCNFPNCPRTSIYEASERDYRLILASNAMSGLYTRGEQELKNIGVGLMETEEIVQALARHAEQPAASAA